MATCRWVWPWFVLAGLVGCRPPAPQRWNTFEPGLLSWRLPSNGLRIVVVPDARANQIQLTMRYFVGSADDPSERDGMAHLVEHLTFALRAAPDRAPLWSRLEAITTRFNAETQVDSTSFTSHADPSRLAELLQLEAERLTSGCGALTDEEFRRERDVVRNELVQRPAGRLLEAATNGIYPPGHPYRRQLGGSPDSVGRITRDEACAFLAGHYALDHAVLIVTGNVAQQAVAAAVTQQLGGVTGHRANRADIQPIPPARRSVSVRVPASTPAGLVAWRLPAQPRERARMRAVATLIEAHLDDSSRGGVRMFELGGIRARMVVFLVVPGKQQALEAALVEVANAGSAAAAQFSTLMFENARARAVHRLMARFEAADERDDLLAEHVFAGREPDQGMREEIESVLTMTELTARNVARFRFQFSDATFVGMLPDATRSNPEHEPAITVGPDVESTAPHELVPATHRDELRATMDPATADQPARPLALDNPLAGVRERTLANGLRVILMPLSSVPTVDIRLMFDAGLTAEPRNARGLSVVAAHALDLPVEGFAYRDRGAMRAFYAAGGHFRTRVDYDHTTIATRGLDMDAHDLLSGIAWLVRSADYGRFLRGWTNPARLDRMARDNPALRETLPELWRYAVYGPAHPYTRVGDSRRPWFDSVDRSLLFAFRESYLRADRATLVVAGGFDPAIIDPWIDRLFAEWGDDELAAGVRVVARARRAQNPQESSRSITVAHVQPTALANPRDDTQLAVDLALEVAGGRAEALIAAEMLDGSLADVRTRLGASYGINALLSESRQATQIRITGRVAVERSDEAIALLRDRIDQLATAGDAAARFVAARRLVIARLSSAPVGATSLASLAEDARARGQPITGNLTTAEQARQLTLTRLAPALASIRLDRAAILLRGPRDAITRAFAALGRTPRFVD